MSKKTMLLALAAVSGMLLALPAIASAQEIHLEVGNGEAFGVTGLFTGIKSENEPTFTCESTHGTGQFNTGGSTTGSETLTSTGCHFNVFGMTMKCHSEGSTIDNAIIISGTLHLITWKNSSGTAFPAFLFTLTPTKVFCGGTTTYSGSVIGTITSPQCGAESKTITLSFTGTEFTQSHMAYTGVNYDIKALTGTEDVRTTALYASTTITTANAQRLVCT
jgi:hypothetical protein